MRRRVWPPFIVGIGSFLVFLIFQSTGIYGGDSGDLVTAAATFGVPHPPGYPLYTFLGWLSSQLPLSTPAWRVGLLSSLPHAMTISVIYLIVYQLTRHRIAAMLSGVFLLGNYLFFLYSVTPETFALLDLFVALLLYLFLRWADTKNPRTLYAAAFVFGLSLTHHHMILFLFPAIGYIFYKSYNRYNSYILVFLFLLGLIPYLYIPLAARGTSIVNWDRAVDLSHFLRLITRADYGTFVANSSYLPALSHRLMLAKLYGQFVWLDFTWPGVVLALLGLYAVSLRSRHVAVFLLLGLIFLGPGFFFYSNFPVVNRFVLGTFERFLLPSYVLLSVCIGLGMAYVTAKCRVPSPARVAGLAGIVILVILSIPPLVTGGRTAWRFWGLREDRTAERLAEDIIKTASPGAVLLLARDTPLFTSQYVRYTLGVRPDLMLLQLSRMDSQDYPETVTRVFPQLSFPAIHDAATTKAFILAHAKTHPIYSNVIISVGPGWYWVPNGLLFTLTKEDDLPTLDTLVVKNEALWQKYQDPASGILARFDHLMLSEVNNVYALSRIAYGKALLRGEQFAAARDQFRSAIGYDPDTEVVEAWVYHGLASLYLHLCEEARVSFQYATDASIITDSRLTVLTDALSSGCPTEKSVIGAMWLAYEKNDDVRETPLKQL